MKFLKKLKHLIYINESNEDDKYVYRLDDQRIKNFNRNMKTYGHNKDWTNSYAKSAEEKLKENYSETRGLFAGKIAKVAPYAAPRGLQFLKYRLQQQYYIVFNKEDEQKIKNHKTYLTQFDKKDFIELKESEQFFYIKKNEKEKKIKPKSQKKINNPIKFMEEQGYKILFVDDLKEEIERIKKDKKFKILDIEGF